MPIWLLLPVFRGKIRHDGRSEFAEEMQTWHVRYECFERVWCLENQIPPAENADPQNIESLSEQAQAA